MVLVATVLLFLNGCGSGTGDEAGETNLKPVTPKVVNKDYSLWEYMTPSSDKINNFSLYSNDAREASETYTTDYTVSANSVTEVSSYALGEKTVYTKKENEIVIAFYKDNSRMGFFEISLQADIGDKITKKDSDCVLEKHYPQYSGQFDDVIEIVCGEQHGFYQKGIGEISQIAQNETDKEVRVLSN